MLVLVPMFASAQETGPNATYQLAKQASAREKAGKWTDAASLWKRLVVINPTMPDYWERLGQASKRIRDYPSAIRGFRRALELGATYPAPMAYEIAVCYALSADKENALLWLRKTLSLGFRSLDWVRDDEQLESLRSDPEFQSLAMVADVQSMTRVEGWRYDLTFLVSELKRRHYSPFRKVSKEVFDAAVVELHAGFRI